MQYQTKWMTNMLKLFASRRSSIIRTLSVAGLIIGSLGIAFISLQRSLLNAQAQPATLQHSGQARSVSIGVSSHIDRQTVAYTVVVRTAAHTSAIHSDIPITFTDNIPAGLSNISTTGDHWDLKVSSKVSPSSVTGTYKGSYPIEPGVSLPAVVIKGSINKHASNVLTNSASVNVWGNTDKTHNKAVVSDNIQATLSSLISNDSSSNCDSSCNINDNNSCDNSCNQPLSNACDNECSDSQSTSDACDNQCATQQSTSDACDNQCAQTSTHGSVEAKVHITVQESQSETESVDTSQQNTVSNDPLGKGSTTPLPAMPNTGSNPNVNG